MSFFPEPGTVGTSLVTSDVRTDMLELLNEMIEKVKAPDCDIEALMVAGVHKDGSFLGATAIRDGLPLTKVTQSLKLLDDTIYEANAKHNAESTKH